MTEHEAVKPQTLTDIERWREQIEADQPSTSAPRPTDDASRAFVRAFLDGTSCG